MTINAPHVLPIVLTDTALSAPVQITIGHGRAAYWTAPCPGKTTANEDSLAIISIDPSRAVLAVADGFGGQPSGGRASKLAIEAVATSVSANTHDSLEPRNAILDAFENANAAVMDLGIGAATTLAVVELNGDSIRAYHVGDSEIIVVGQRGKVKFQSISHSPVGHGVEAGLIEPDEAIHHEDRNLVSNMVGSQEMRIDVGSTLRLNRRDTVLIASDGVFDNLSVDEIIEIIRKGRLHEVSLSLAEQLTARMKGDDAQLPGKPDDVAFALFRLAI
ncbi:MAG: PP2C family protein-serine/threonine phosphatase [Planctomycetota bacterium]